MNKLVGCLALAIMLLESMAIAAEAEASTPSYYWVRATASAAWQPRMPRGGVALLDGTLWLTGGSEGYETFPDVWSSTDGVTWTLATATAPWGERCYHATVVFDNRLWLLGGSAFPAGVFNDVWCSWEGTDWSRVTESAAWSPRSKHTCAVHNGGMFVMGGSLFDPPNGVWFSEDGENWDIITSDAPWTARNFHGTAVFDDRLWITGGYYSESGHTLNLNDVWCSPDGANWTEVTEHAPWQKRGNHATVAFDDKLWVIGGGYTGYSISLMNDVWYSANGADWTQLPDTPWSPRWGHAAVVFDDKLWVLGGAMAPEGSFIQLNDIWYLAKGDGGPTIEDRAGWVEAGQPLSLSVSFPAALGSVTYQWYKDGAALADETGETLCIESTTVDDSGTYWCVASDEAKAAHESNHVEVQIVAQGALPSAGHATLYALAAAVALTGTLLLAARTRRV